MYKKKSAAFAALFLSGSLVFEGSHFTGCVHFIIGQQNLFCHRTQGRTVGDLLAEYSNCHIRLRLVLPVGKAHKDAMVRTAGCVFRSTGLGVDDNLTLQRPDTVLVTFQTVVDTAELLIRRTAGGGDNLTHTAPVGIHCGSRQIHLVFHHRFVLINQRPVIGRNHAA